MVTFLLSGAGRNDKRSVSERRWIACVRKHEMKLVAEYGYSRKLALVLGSCLGIAAGVFNTFLPLIDFTPRVALYGWAAAALVATIVLHEGVHGLVAVLLKHKPLFGIRLPFFYTTFLHKIPRNDFIPIVLGPLVILDIVFGVLLGLGILPTFSYMVLMMNTIGAMGDVWLTIFLVKHDGSALIQDTKNGIEVWIEE